MPTDPHRIPKAPEGYVACRSMFYGGQTTHLVALDEHGSNGGRPTACGLTRFDDRTPQGDIIPKTAGLPGWGMGDSGHSGPGVKQVKCVDCYAVAAPGARAESEGEER